MLRNLMPVANSPVGGVPVAHGGHMVTSTSTDSALAAAGIVPGISSLPAEAAAATGQLIDHPLADPRSPLGDCLGDDRPDDGAEAIEDGVEAVATDAVNRRHAATLSNLAAPLYCPLTLQQIYD